ncbi:MAG: SDR family NAD(P)-dependent oxidoreductase, partial [Rhodospirillaceae bacterium]|nr:SDR family NAD(P)-dependent oxidoreductase [Rhodospirillaceae bacterium]
MQKLKMLASDMAAFILGTLILNRAGVGMTGRVGGKIALVTGGASGLGKSTAELLVAEGARVAITDIDVDAGRAVAGSIGENAMFLRHDVTDEDQWKMVLRDVVGAFGGLHILVNSAGIS